MCAEPTPCVRSGGTLRVHTRVRWGLPRCLSDLQVERHVYEAKYERLNDENGRGHEGNDKPQRACLCDGEKRGPERDALERRPDDGRPVPPGRLRGDVEQDELHHEKAGTSAPHRPYHTRVFTEV